jgi:hypothetical protein
VHVGSDDGNDHCDRDRQRAECDDRQRNTIWNLPRRYVRGALTRSNPDRLEFL